MSEIRASILICTCNRADHLEQTLASLSRVCVPETLPCELLVIDNASTDRTPDLVQTCRLPNMPVRYLYEPKRGQGRARNTGLAHAGGEIILFTDDDVRFPSHWLSGMCAPILEGRTHAAAGSVRIAPHLERPWMERQHRIWLSDCDFRNTERPHVMIGANNAYSRKVLEQAPCYDAELGPGALGFYDDVLFSCQVEEAGFPILSAGDVVIEHHFDAERLKCVNLVQRAVREGRSLAYFYYHWLHSDFTYSQLHLARHLAVGLLRRAAPPKSSLAKEGWPILKLEILKDIAFHRQYLIERQRPRNYGKRGLRKRALE